MGLKLPKKILGSILAFLKSIAKTTVMFTIYGIYFWAFLFAEGYERCQKKVFTKAVWKWNFSGTFRKVAYDQSVNWAVFHACIEACKVQ